MLKKHYLHLLSIGLLIGIISTFCPTTASAAVSKDEAIDNVAYLLQQNNQTIQRLKDDVSNWGLFKKNETKKVTLDTTEIKELYDSNKTRYTAIIVAVANATIESGFTVNYRKIDQTKTEISVTAVSDNKTAELNVELEIFIGMTSEYSPTKYRGDYTYRTIGSFAQNLPCRLQVKSAPAGTLKVKNADYLVGQPWSAATRSQMLESATEYDGTNVTYYSNKIVPSIPTSISNSINSTSNRIDIPFSGQIPIAFNSATGSVSATSTVSASYGNAIQFEGYEWGTPPRIAGGTFALLEESGKPKIIATSGGQTDNDVIHSSFSGKLYQSFGWYSFTGKTSLDITNESQMTKQITANGDTLKQDFLNQWGSKREQAVAYGDVVRAQSVEPKIKYFSNGQLQTPSNLSNQKDIFFEVTTHGFVPIDVNQASQIFAQPVELELGTSSSEVQRLIQQRLASSAYKKLTLSTTGIPSIDTIGDQTIEVTLQQKLSSGKTVSYRYPLKLVVKKNRLLEFGGFESFTGRLAAGGIALVEENGQPKLAAVSISSATDNEAIHYRFPNEEYIRIELYAAGQTVDLSNTPSKQILGYGDTRKQDFLNQWGVNRSMTVGYGDVLRVTTLEGKVVSVSGNTTDDFGSAANKKDLYFELTKQGFKPLNINQAQKLFELTTTHPLGTTAAALQQALQKRITDNGFSTLTVQNTGLKTLDVLGDQKITFPVEESLSTGKKARLTYQATVQVSSPAQAVQLGGSSTGTRVAGGTFILQDTNGAPAITASPEKDAANTPLSSNQKNKGNLYVGIGWLSMKNQQTLTISDTMKLTSEITGNGDTLKMDFLNQWGTKTVQYGDILKAQQIDSQISYYKNGYLNQLDGFSNKQLVYFEITKQGFIPLKMNQAAPSLDTLSVPLGSSDSNVKKLIQNKLSTAGLSTLTIENQLPNITKLGKQNCTVTVGETLQSGKKVCFDYALPINSYVENGLRLTGYELSTNRIAGGIFVLNTENTTPTIIAANGGSENDTNMIHSAFQGKKYLTVEVFTSGQAAPLNLTTAKPATSISANGETTKESFLNQWGTNRSVSVHYGDILHVQSAEPKINLFNQQQLNKLTRLADPTDIYFEVTKTGLQVLQINQLKTNALTLSQNASQKDIDQQLSKAITVPNQSTTKIESFMQYPDTSKSGKQQGTIVVSELLSSGKRVSTTYTVDFTIQEAGKLVTQPITVKLGEPWNSATEATMIKSAKEANGAAVGYPNKKLIAAIPDVLTNSLKNQRIDQLFDTTIPIEFQSATGTSTGQSKVTTDYGNAIVLDGNESDSWNRSMPRNAAGAFVLLEENNQPVVVATSGISNDNQQIHNFFPNKTYVTIAWQSMQNASNTDITNSQHFSKVISAKGTDYKQDFLDQWGTNRVQQVNYGDIIKVEEAEAKISLYTNSIKQELPAKEVYFEVTKSGFKVLPINQLKPKTLRVLPRTTTAELNQLAKTVFDTSNHKDVMVGGFTDYPDTSTIGNKQAKILVTQKTATGQYIAFEYPVTVAVTEGSLRFTQVPATLSFEDGTTTNKSQLLYRRDNNFTLSVADTRSKQSAFQIMVKQATPFTENRSKNVLKDILVYRTKEAEQLVNTQTAAIVFDSQQQMEDSYTISWSKEEGLLLQVPANSTIQDSSYTSQLEWVLQDAP